MWSQTPFTIKFELTLPIVQAGMAGGPTTPELIAGVCAAGGLGTLGGGYLSPEALRQQIHTIKRLTDRPFAVNLFVSESVQADPELVGAVQSHLNDYRVKLGMDPTDSSSVPHKDTRLFESQLDVLIEERVPIFQCTFGIPKEDVCARLRQAGIRTIGTATSVREARLCEEAGLDAVTIQGSEAGGHRGTFAGRAQNALIGTLALCPQVVDAVKIPVIAAGGIMDGRGIAACLALGASGVQLGTAFLTCQESGVNPVHRDEILSSNDESTTLTRAFSGKLARGIRNRMTEDFAQNHPDIPPYPVQNELTRDIRATASRQGERDYMSLWAGQASGLARLVTVRELMKRLVEETNAVLLRVSKMGVYEEK